MAAIKIFSLLVNWIDKWIMCYAHNLPKLNMIYSGCLRSWSNNPQPKLFHFKAEISHEPFMQPAYMFFLKDGAQWVG